MKYRGLINKSRTLDFGTLVVVFGFIQTTLPDLDLPPLWQGIANMLIGSIVIVLRAQTNGPVGQKNVE